MNSSDTHPPSRWYNRKKVISVILGNLACKSLSSCVKVLEEIAILNLDSLIPAWIVTLSTRESSGTFDILSIRCSIPTPDQEKISTFSPSEVDITFFGIGFGMAVQIVNVISIVLPLGGARRLAVRYVSL